jgi:hypothetical protein
MADRSSEPPFTSLDHLVGVRSHRGRHVEAKRLGGLEVDDDNDLILVWGSQRRIITGSDLLGRLLRGIANVEAGNPARQGTVALLQN